VNLTLSPPIKILALVLVLAGVAFVASLSLMGKSATTVPAGERHGSAERRTTTHATPAATAAAKASKPAKAAATKAPATKAPATAAAAKPAAKPVAKPKARPKPVQRGNLVYSTLPKPLQWALSQHKVVVVSLYNPNADVDAIAVAEAHQGAIDAGAGFLLVSVLDNKIAGILTALLPGGGLLPDPGVLVYRAPGDIALRLDGFHDRFAVAQAATNATAGATDPTQATGGTVPAAAPTATAPTAPATLTP
jgi:hypothetical protein